MNNYNNRGSSDRGGFKGGDRGARTGGSDFKKRSFGNDRGGDREVTLYKATCADCHKVCEVPFRPNGEKPVFCRDCFGAKRGNEERGDDRGGDRRERPSYESKAPAHIWSDRNPSVPAYAKPEAKPQVSEEMKRQISDILYKIDKLTHLVEKLSEVKPVAVKAPLVKVEEVIVTKEETTEEVPKKKAPAKKKVAKKAE